MRTAIFSEAFALDRDNTEINFLRVGNNTGNLAFFRALRKLYDPDFIKPYYGISGDNFLLDAYDAFITTDLIWITQNTRYENTEKILKNIGGRPLIPISVGLQCEEFISDFKLHENTVRLLNEISERCVVGVRGNYTAEILSGYGIKNIEVVGCPSLYYKSDYIFDETPMTENKTLCNFKSFWGKCEAAEYNFLEYCMKGNFAFVEQTVHKIDDYNISDPERFSLWIKNTGRIFFDIDRWSDFDSQYSFCIGMRFHGNVIAMQSGVRSLFITVDSRTKELTEFFQLPSIDIKEFDQNKSISEYRDLTDYSAFDRKFKNCKNNFRDFSVRNNLEVNI